MPAGRRVPRVVEEDDAEVGVVVVRRAHEAAVHVGVSSRLVDEKLPHVIEVLRCESPPLEDRRPLERGDAVRDDPKRLAAGVVVGCPHDQRAARRGHLGKDPSGARTNRGSRGASRPPRSGGGGTWRETPVRRGAPSRPRRREATSRAGLARSGPSRTRGESRSSAPRSPPRTGSRRPTRRVRPRARRRPPDPRGKTPVSHASGRSSIGWKTFTVKLRIDRPRDSVGRRELLEAERPDQRRASGRGSTGAPRRAASRRPLGATAARARWLSERHAGSA